MPTTNWAHGNGTNPNTTDRISTTVQEKPRPITEISCATAISRVNEELGRTFNIRFLSSSVFMLCNFRITRRKEWNSWHATRRSSKVKTGRSVDPCRADPVTKTKLARPFTRRRSITRAPSCLSYHKRLLLSPVTPYYALSPILYHRHPLLLPISPHCTSFLVSYLRNI